MPIRHSKNSLVPIIESRRKKEEWSELDTMIGHPCGFICYAMWLARNPVKSLKVSRYLSTDAGSVKDPGNIWNACSFASMIFSMQEAGCAIDPRGKDLIRWWVKGGKQEPWTQLENRVYARLDGVYINTPLDDVRWLVEAHLETGAAEATAYSMYPSPEERAMIEAMPMVYPRAEATDIPY